MAGQILLGSDYKGKFLCSTCDVYVPFDALRAFTFAEVAALYHPSDDLGVPCGPVYFEHWMVKR